MRWLYPSWFWLQILPLSVLAASILAGRTQTRLLRRFGNPAVLKLSAGNGWQAGGTLLRVLGMALVAAVLCAPVRPEHRVPTIEFVLDYRPSSGSFSEAEHEWDRLCDAVSLLAEEMPQRRYSAYLQGDPPQLLVPATPDSGGLLLILNGALPLDSPGDIPGRSPGSGTAQDSFGPEGSVVVVSPRGREEIMQLWPSGSYAGSRALFLSVQDNSIEGGMPAVDGNWKWTPQSGSAQASITEIEGGDRIRGPLWRQAELVQVLGLAAFVLLLAESALPLARTSLCRKERY